MTRDERPGPLAEFRRTMPADPAAGSASMKDDRRAGLRADLAKLPASMNIAWPPRHAVKEK